MNRMKTLVLLAMLTALLLWVGQALAGRAGLLIALAVAGTLNFASYWFSDKIVLRMHGAQEVTEAAAPGLHALVRDLAIRGNLPLPKVYVMPEEAPNAFATGRNPNHAAVAVTEGLLRSLNRQELSGVIAHELAHVQNRDTLIMTATATIAGALSMLANTAMWGMMFSSGRSSDSDEESQPSGWTDRSHSGAVPGNPHSNGDLSIQRIPGGPAWRPDNRRPACPCQRIAQDRGDEPGVADDCRYPGDGPPIHSESIFRRRPDAPIQHPPADASAHSASRGAGA